MLKNILCDYNNSETQIREFFNYEFGLEPFIDLTDTYWTIQNDLLWCGESKSNFNEDILKSNLIVFPISNSDHIEKDRFVVVSTCEIKCSNVKEKLVAFPDCDLNIILLNKNQLQNVDVPRFADAVKIEFCRGL